MRLGRPPVIRSALAVLRRLASVCRIDPDTHARGLIFTLHHVRHAQLQPFAPAMNLEVTPGFLDSILGLVRELDYDVISLPEVPTRLATSTSNRQFVAFTLDDGYRDNLEVACPIFEKHQAPFTVFPTAGFVNRERTLWWKTLEHLIASNDRLVWDAGGRPVLHDCSTVLRKFATYRRLVSWLEEVDEDSAVKALDRIAIAHGVDPCEIVDREVMTADELLRLSRRPGVTIGAHSWSHINLKRATPERLNEELRRGTDEIASIIGYRPALFAYPYGSGAAAGPREFAAAATDFEIAVTTTPRLLYASDRQHLASLPRVSLNGLYQDRHYVEALMSGLPFRLHRQLRAALQTSPGSESLPA
jgi:peptidoglycan/xylan/chitin deacetylase (PgdA/CDA1 family)